MKRNCNLELGLSQPPPLSSISHHHQQQQLTIFYDGRISVCDVTKLQARAIIREASKQMDEERCKGRGFDSPNENGYNSASTSGMSMKKSLERFLQKRKDRHVSKP